MAESKLQARTVGVLDGARSLVEPDDRPEFASIIEDLRTAEQGRPAIVVVGEVGAGKSSLVNALIGQDLSPTGVGETTGTYLRFEPPSDELALGRARIDFPDGHQVEIPQAELPEWVTIGRGRLATEDGELPFGAVAAVNLQDLVVIDTPGSGGLNPAHARVAIATAERASVLVLVTDAGGRITEPALRFLDDCAQHVEAIVVAVNQIDKLPGWEEVVAEDAALLRARDPRYEHVPVVGVSAMLANQSRTRSTPESRERIRQASRLDELVAAIREKLAIADQLPAARAVRQSHRLLARELGAAQGRLDALAVGQDGLARLQQDQERLVALQQKDAKWRRWLQREFAEVGDEIGETVRMRTDEYAASWNERITKSVFGFGKGQLARLHADMEVEANFLYLQLDDIIRWQITRIATELFASVDLGDFQAEIFGDSGIPRDTKGLPPIVRRGGKADMDPGLLSTTMIGGSLLTGMLGGAAAIPALAGISVALPFLAPVGAAGMLTLTLLSRSGLKNKRDALSHAERMVPRVRETIQSRLGQLIREYRDQIEDVFGRELGRMVKEATGQVQAAMRAQKESAQQLETDRLELETRVQSLEKQLARGARELRRLLGIPAEESGTSAA